MKTAKTTQELGILRRLNLGRNATEEEIKIAKEKSAFEHKAYMTLEYLKKDKLRIAKRMAYEKLVKDVRDIEIRKMLLEKDDKHVEQVLKQFGIKIEIGETIRV